MVWRSRRSRYGEAAIQVADGSIGAPSDQSDAAWRTWGLALGAIAVAAQLTLVWGFEFFPSVDGPAHVHLAHALYEALRGDGFYGSLVELNSKISPNMATQGMMVALMAIASPFVAEKIWLTLYFASFVGAGAYTLSGINKNSLCFLPFLTFCSISFPVAFGFYNFSFSTVVFLAWFGFWWRHRDRFTMGIVLGHALFAAIAYVTHIFAFIVTLLGIGLAATTAILLRVHRDWKNAVPDPRQWRYPLLSHALPPLLGSIPELIACLHFLFFRFGAYTTAGAAKLAAEPERLIKLFVATSLTPYDRTESIPAAIFVPTLLFLLYYLVRRGSDLKGSIPIAACFAGFLVLYLIMPQQWIVRWMPARFQPLVFVMLLLWLAALMPAATERAHWKLIGAVGVIILFVSVAVRFEIFNRLDGYYREYASAAPYIAENSTLIGLRLHNRLDGRPFPANVDVLIQAGSRIASIRHSVDLKNFQGQSSDHPIQFRPGIAATAALGGDSAITAVPPRVNLMAYEQQTGRPIDYILFYGFRDAVENKDALARLDAQLRGNYRLIYVSKPRGFVHLYARNLAIRPANAASH
jgi:hypothetical protein